MIKFIVKTIFFCLPVFIFMSIPSFTKYIMDADLEAKINTFLPEGNNVELFIAGDSRAERQLIPSLFKSELSLETVNIAKDVGDVVSLVYANEKYNFADSSKVFVMCLSSLITNDGAYKNWFMSQASMTEIGLVKCILLFKNDYIENWYRRMGLIWDDLIKDKRGMGLPQEDIRVKYSGFMPIDKQLDIGDFSESDLNPKTTEHLWYRKPNNNGIRRAVFEESVKQFLKTGAKIVLIQSPMAPAWRKNVGENYMHQLELDHGKLLSELASHYNNVWAIDFYTKQPNVFTDDLFYNATHLNKTGAVTFTKTVIDSLFSKDVIN